MRSVFNKFKQQQKISIVTLFQVMFDIVLARFLVPPHASLLKAAQFCLFKKKK